MTQNIQIIEVENKLTKAGKPFSRVNTSMGWLACFDKDSCGLLPNLIGKTAVVEIKQSVANKGTPEEKVFQNIAKVLGEAQEDKVEVVKMNVPVETKGYSKTTRQDTFHTAYAKDVFIAMLEGTDKNAVIDPKAMMETAIGVVQQAKDHFE